MKLCVCVLIGASVVAAAAGRAGAVNVYMLSSGDIQTDEVARSALTSRGHQVTIGVPYTQFDGTQSLAGYDTVYLQVNYNWGVGDMPVPGQQALVNWVNGGGRLVTCEWIIWKVGTGAFQTLGPVLPAAATTSYTTTTEVTLTQATANAALNANLPAQFTFPVTNFGGTETIAQARPGATVYYTSSTAPGLAGLSGWRVGTGSVFSFSTTCGPSQTFDTTFGRLFSNVMGATAAGGCYANCDGSSVAPVLNVLDFNCFLNRFSSGDPYANCDGSTVAPVLNVLDFNCFLNRFSAGCP